MSKVDAQRAIREARYARFAEGKKAEPSPPSRRSAAEPAPTAELFAAPEVTTATARPSARPKARTETLPESSAATPTLLEADEPEAGEPVAGETVAGTPEDDEPEADAAAELCGHRAISGRTCTREKGHPQKNHRYN